MLKRLIFKSIKKDLIFQIGFYILCSICLALIPYMNKLLFDHVLSGGFEMLIKLLLLYLLIVLGRNVFSYFTRIYEFKVSKAYRIAIKDKIFNVAYHRRANKYDNLTNGEYISLIINNVDAIDEEYIEAFSNIIMCSIQLIVNSIILFVFVDWRIALAIFIASMLSFYIPKLTARSLANKKNSYIKQMGKYTAQISDFFKGNYGLDMESKNHIIKHHQQILHTTENKFYTWGSFKSFADVINTSVMDLVSITAFVMIGILFTTRQITIGTGVATLGYIEIYVNPINDILGSFNALHSVNKVMSELEEFLFTEDSTDNIKQIELGTINTIAFKNVSLKRGNFELKNFNYTFKANNSYALIGHSGAGKSTIIQLLSGRIPADKGEILINGVEVNDYLDIIAMKYFFIINQDYHTFMADYYNNITNFGAYDENKIKSKLRLLPSEMITRIKTINSDKLSGGEKQVLALMKSSIADKKVFLFDEATSSIDKKNLTMINNFINNLDYNILIEISHELSPEYLNKFSFVLEFEKGELKY